MNAHQRRQAVRAWRIRAETSAFGHVLESRELPVRVLSQLLEYSLTTPTGAGPGRVWRMNLVAFVRHCYAYQSPEKRAAFRELMMPPRWLRASWVLATVLPEPDANNQYEIRYQRIRLVPETARPSIVLKTVQQVGELEPVPTVTA